MEDLVDASEIATQLGEELIASILLNSSAAVIKDLVDAGAPVWYQSEAEGTSPLHAAAYIRNLELVQFLIDKGAVWNAVDYLQHTAGDIALSYNDGEIYNAIRDAGIRTELLLGALSSRSEKTSDTSTNIILQETDASAAGSSEKFLSSRLRYTKDETGQDICFVDVDGEDIGVMMGWETPIMVETVQSIYDSLLERDNLRVLNVGFGLGIIDGLFQALPSPPSQHVIIEPHPDVLQYMRDNGWYQKQGVKILEGKWQDFVEQKDFLALGGFDAIYTDTFSENYNDLREFFKHLPNLLSGTHARFSFFNGLGATNPLFYDVYTQISELNLSKIGLKVQWSEVDVRPQKYDERWDHSLSARETSQRPGSKSMFESNGLDELHNGLNVERSISSVIASIYQNGSSISSFSHVPSPAPWASASPSMTIFSLYIFDRHCTCVYYQDWHRTKRPKPAVDGNLLPAVSLAVSPPAIAEKANVGASNFSSPRNTLSASTGIVVASSESAARSTPPPPSTVLSQQHPTGSSTGLPFDEEVKLVYGVVLSLRNMVKKLSGRDESFTSYRTSTYKLHLHETVSGYKFVMLTDPKTDSLRFVLRQMYAGPFVEYVVRNPLSKMDSKEHGIDNEYFRTSIDRVVRGLSVFA